ncbi:MAG: cupin domain-containing protein [Methanoregulaceae archaeon]|jgi:quercetin dioxygenase-like cupin family protein|nr:cupin domain-containing protein [Methanoregulaceae archaeon]
MEPKHIRDIFEQGAVLFPDFENDAAEIPWKPHPKWEGVFLKDLVTGKATGGKFSYHLVKVNKDFEVKDHDHTTQWEWNLIISGDGIFVIGDKEVTIEPGQTFVTPPGIHHIVSAGDQDLLLLAIFTPALC